MASNRSFAAGWLHFQLARRAHAVGVLMQFYRMARRRFGKMTARCDPDKMNVALCWHFLGLTGIITRSVLAGFPLLH